MSTHGWTLQHVLKIRLLLSTHVVMIYFAFRGTSHQSNLSIFCSRVWEINLFTHISFIIIRRNRALNVLTHKRSLREMRLRRANAQFLAFCNALIPPTQIFPSWLYTCIGKHIIFHPPVVADGEVFFFVFVFRSGNDQTIIWCFVWLRWSYGWPSAHQQ